MSKKIICPSCGAEFEENMDKCPYCGNVSIEGAESAYMGKLEDMKEELSELKNVPAEEAKEAVLGLVKILVTVFIIIAILVAVLLTMNHMRIQYWF